MKYKLFAKIIKPLILTVVIFGSLFVSNFASASVDLSSGLLAHYKMNDNTSSTKVIDSAGGMDGTASFNTSDQSTAGVSSNTTPVTDHGALSFNGTNGVNLGNNFNFERTDHFSVNLWVKLSANETFANPLKMIIGNNLNPDHTTPGWSVFTYYGGMYVQLNGGTYYQQSEIQINYSSPNLVVGEWKMLTLTYDGSSSASGVHLYMDGAEIPQGGAVDTLNSSILSGQGTHLGTGADFDSRYLLNGDMDDVRIYNRVINADEIAALNNGGNGTEEGDPSLTATTKYWVGNGGNWSDPNNWSATSGGSGGAGVPVPGDTVIFDSGNSYGSCYIDVDTNVDNIQILDGYYAYIYQNSYETITTTNGISQGNSTGTFYGGSYSYINASGNIIFNNFSSSYTNISGGGSVYISTGYGDINLNSLYANYGASLYTYNGSVYVNEWNSYGSSDTVFAQYGYVNIYGYYGNINLGYLYSSYGTNLSSYYGNVYVNDWNSYGYSDTASSQYGSVSISSYSNNINLSSVYSYYGTSLYSYYGGINVQEFDGWGNNQVSTYYGSVNLSSYYYDINLSYLNGANVSLAPNTSSNFQGVIYQSGTFSISGGGTLYIYGSLNNYNNSSIGGNVEFVGTADAYISGSTYISGNFTCSQPNKHFYFQPGYTTTITGDFHIAGDSSNPVYLMSQSNGNQWQIDPQGTRSVDYANVQDSNNINATAVDQTNSIDGGNNTNWTFSPTGPLCVPATDDPLYTVCTYKKSDTFIVPEGVTTAQVLVVAGGGGGGIGTSNPGNAGGGGGGGLINNTSYAISSGSYTVTVGNGGAEGANGEDSVFNDLTAVGGGAGGFWSLNSQQDGDGKLGGSGGGAGQSTYWGAPIGGLGVVGQGYDGGAGGGVSSYGGAGGGGAGGVGLPTSNLYGNYENGGNGGDGIQSSITGTPTYYAGGGGGSTHGSNGNTRSSGGLGGGGVGNYNGGATAGTASLGGGGGGGGENYAGGKGGSGVVIIRYLNPLGAGLVAHYKMNDNTSSTNVIDNKGGNTGTAIKNTSAMHATGKINGALDFNGSSDYINVGNPSDLQLQQFTAITWIKPSAQSYGFVFSHPQTGSSGWGLVYGNAWNGVDYALHFDDAWVADVLGYSVNLNDGNYHQVGIYRDIDNNVGIIVDGKIVATGVYTNTFGFGNFDIGARDGDSKFNGSIDDVRIYNHALSAADVSALYNWGDGTEDDGAAVITLSATGSQISTTTIPITGQNLGGAFLLTSTVNSATVSSIKLKKTGSLSTSTISNIILSYKDAVGGQCSATKPSGTTLFGTAGNFDSNNYVTTTGTMELNQDTPVCLYTNYNLIGTFSTSSIGSSVDFEIANPSTDIIITGGAVSTTNSVNISGQTIVVGSTGSGLSVNPTSCTNSGITSLLSLKMKDPTQDPTVFYLENCAVWKIVGGGTPIRLTNPNLQVHSLNFTNLTGISGGGTIRINMSMSNVDASSSPSYINTSKTYSTTATVKSWGGSN